MFTDDEREVLHTILNRVSANPYANYQAFSRSVARIADEEEMPLALLDACRQVRDERRSGTVRGHVLRNCPLDRDLSVRSRTDVDDRHAERSGFVSEAFVALTARLTEMPLMAYRDSNRGRFFDDVIAVEGYSSKQSAFSDGDLVYHSDRSMHWARPDQVHLLAMMSPEREVVYTSYADGRALINRLSPQEQGTLREKYFVTSFQAGPRGATPSEAHSILEGKATVRYVDTITTVAPGSPPDAKDALIAVKNALTLVRKQCHRLVTGDLLILENQEGLHCRDIMEMWDASRPQTRWLLKAYSFRDDKSADSFAGKWSGNIRGLIPG